MTSTRESVSTTHRFMMDGHNDSIFFAQHHGGIERFEKGWPGAQLSLAGFRKGGFDAAFFAIFGAEEERAEHRPEVAAQEVDRLMKGYLDWLGPSPEYSIIETAADLRGIAALAEEPALGEELPQRAFGVLLHLEGARGLRDLDHLHRLHEQGLRSLGLTWNLPNAYATGAVGDPNAGLTNRGLDLVRELEALSMVIDASHLNRQGLKDLLNTATRPVLVTHTACAKFFDHPRNLDDDQLRAVAATGGTIGIFAVNIFLGPQGKPITMQTMVDQYRHLVDVVGISHVALGTDLGGVSSGTPQGLTTIEDTANLLAALAADGWSESDLTALAGGNYLRVLDQLLPQ